MLAACAARRRAMRRDATHMGDPEMLPNTPENIGGVLDAGIRLYRVNFRVLTTIAGLLFGTSLLGIDLMPADPAASTLGELYSPSFVALSLVGFFIATLAYAALIRQLKASASGTPLTAGASVREGFGRMISVTVALVLYILLVSVGAVLLVIPGIWLATATGFAVIFAAEGSGPVAAIRQSFTLVKGHWWRTTAVFAVIFLLIFAVSFMFGALPGAVAGYNAAANGEVSIRTFQLISMIGNTLASMFMMPLGFAMTFAAYRDLQLRKSGEDLEARLGTLEG